MKTELLWGHLLENGHLEDSEEGGSRKWIVCVGMEYCIDIQIMTIK
jgi:hypothetical protein